MPEETNGISGDVTPEMLRKLLIEKSNFHSILMKIATEYINIPVDKYKHRINESLREIAEFVDADRAYIFDYNHVDKTTSNTFEYCQKDILPEIENLQNIPYEILPDWTGNHFKGDLVYVPNVEELPEGSLKEILAPQQIKSLISIPMMSADTAIGFVGFDAVKRLRSYSGEEINLLKLFAQMLVNLTLRANQESELNSKNEEIAKMNKFLETALVKETELGHLKTRFITMTSHQFRTPLTTIRSSTDLLEFIAGTLDPVPGDKLRRNIYRIHTEVERLTHLMNDVLFFGKADSEHIQFRPVETDCVALIKDIAETREFVSGDRRRPQVEVKGTERLLSVDAGLFSQMVINLLSNAVKYSAGKPAPVVRMKFTTDGLELAVEDFGVGIPPDDMKNLFHSFFRGSNVENIIGTGLGLAIVRHITELHNGTVSARSVLNEGSVFTIRIPC